MSNLKSGQWRRFRGRSVSTAALITSIWVFFAPVAPIAQDSPDLFLPDIDSDALLMAELVEAEVTFVDPAGIGAVNDLEIGFPYQVPAGFAQVTVAPDSSEGGTKATVENSLQTAASLTITAAPGQPITILVDEVVPGSGYSLEDFRCKYDAGGDRACDGSGYLETSVRRGTLLVGVTLISDSTVVAGAPDGSFDVTISYQ